MKIALVVVMCAAATKVASADQCGWVDEPTAERAARTLDRARYVEMCEPCGDKAPGVPAVAFDVQIRRHDGGAELAIDGRAIDLAYVYVQTSERWYENLAALVGCPATHVSPSLAVDQATPNGVLIHANAAPVAPALPSPEVIYVEAAPQPPSVWPTALVSAGAAAFAVAALARVRRRRRVFEPRADRLREP
jgi:MYXO-CTERM domain-containing protein